MEITQNRCDWIHPPTVIRGWGWGGGKMGFGTWKEESEHVGGVAQPRPLGDTTVGEEGPFNDWNWVFISVLQFLLSDLSTLLPPLKLSLVICKMRITILASSPSYLFTGMCTSQRTHSVRTLTINTVSNKHTIVKI